MYRNVYCQILNSFKGLGVWFRGEGFQATHSSRSPGRSTGKVLAEVPPQSGEAIQARRSRRGDPGEALHARLSRRLTPAEVQGAV